jgi:hypothetical protein
MLDADQYLNVLNHPRIKFPGLDPTKGTSELMIHTGPTRDLRDPAQARRSLRSQPVTWNTPGPEERSQYTDHLGINRLTQEKKLPD